MKLLRYNHPSLTFDSILGDPFEAFAPLFETHVRPRADRSQEWFEDDDHYYVRLDLPGVSKEDLQLDFEPGLVTITRTTGESEEKHQQTLRVPENVDPEKAVANLEFGILTLTLPRIPEPGPVTIEIA